MAAYNGRFSKKLVPYPVEEYIPQWGEYPAAEVIHGQRAVILDSSLSVLHADSATLSHAHSVVGIAGNAAVLSDTVRVLGDGNDVQEGSWAWVVGDPVFVGAAGVLTQVPPTIGFSLIIGFAVKTDMIRIRIHQPIILL